MGRRIVLTRRSVRDARKQRDVEAVMLELDGLTRRFGPVTALDGLSFTVGPGQLFGFV
jgi:ABC-type sugar transport system ATPase subunit